MSGGVVQHHRLAGDCPSPWTFLSETCRGACLDFRADWRRRNPPSTAKTVDVSSGEARVLDEPFVEAPSYVGGFWVIEAANDDAAVEWASKAAIALQCRIEVRALQEAPEA